MPTFFLVAQLPSTREVTWRHDSVLNTIVSFVDSKLRSGFVIYSDLPDFRSRHGGVIPPHIIVTSLRPDLVLINEESRIIVVFELTCPFERNIDREHEYKEGKYAPLVT